MAKKVVEVRECDRCGAEPAQSWVITGPGGTVREIDLCERHGGPVANAFALGRAVPRRTAGRRREHPVVADTDAGTSPAAAPEPVWR